MVRTSTPPPPLPLSLPARPALTSPATAPSRTVPSLSHRLWTHERSFFGVPVMKPLVGGAARGPRAFCRDCERRHGEGNAAGGRTFARELGRCAGIGKTARHVLHLPVPPLRQPLRAVADADPGEKGATSRRAGTLTFFT